MNKRIVSLALTTLCCMQMFAQLEEETFPVDRTKYPDFVPYSRIEKIDLGEPGSFGRPGIRKATKRPDHVYNNETKYFPPVFNQAMGSCGSASAVSYLFTYELNAYRDLDGSLPENQYPSHFTWLTTYQDVDKDDIMMAIGVPNAVAYDGRTYSKTFAKGSNVDCSDVDYGWMQGYDRWYNAMPNKLEKFAMLERDLRDPIGREQLKQWLWNHNGDTSFKSGGCVTMGCAITDCSTAKTPSTTNNVANGLSGKSFLLSWGPTFDHGTTIVGYDDRVECDVNQDGIIQDDEVGAWVMMNSWGEGFGNKGWFYIPYKIPYSVDTDKVPMTVGLWYIRKDYVPERTVRMKMDYTHRSEIYIHAGVSEDLNAEKPDYEIDFEHFRYMSNSKGTTPAPEVPMLGRWKDGMHNEPMEFGYDLTDLTACVDKNKPLKYFFYITTKEGAIGSGKVYDCTLLDYRHNADGDETSSGLTDETPVDIQNDGKTICITIVTAASEMKEPTGLTLSGTSMSWNAPATSLAVSAYNVYCNDELEATVSGNTTRYTITNKHAAYNVRAVYDVEDGTEESSLSNTVSAEVNEKSVSATFSGEISGSYMRYIRDLVQNYNLQNIDMESATIVGRGEPYYMAYRTKDNIFPAYAFNQMSGLKSIVLPANVKEIGEYAFNECTGINTRVEIPGSVKKINQFAFCKCKSLDGVTFNEGLEFIGESAFDDCKGIKELIFPDSFYGAENCAFRSCSWTKVVFGTGYRRAGWCTFYGNVTRTEVYLPTTVVPSRGDYTFDWKGANIHVRADMLDTFLASEEWTKDNKYTFIGDIGAPNAPKDVAISEGAISWTASATSVSNYDIYTNTGTKVATVDANTTTYNLGNAHGLYYVTATNAFGESVRSEYVSTDVNPESTSATIVGDVNNTYLGYIRKMVEECKLQHIDMSDANIVSGGETYFHEFAIVDNELPASTFNNCKNLVSIRLPYSLTKTGFDCIAYCDNLEAIYFGPNIKTIIQGCCYSSNKRMNVYLPVTTVPSGAAYMFYWKGADVHVLPGMAEKFMADKHWGDQEYYTLIEDYGDIDGDNRVSAADITLLIEILNGRKPAIQRANLNGVDGITTDDLNYLRKLILNE